MVIKCQLPSNLQCGDAMELRGKAGPNKLIIDLLSDCMACDPSGADRLSNLDDPNDELFPAVPTQPLQIVLETDGNWDVNASSPVSSTSSHGTTAKRYGFRPGEDFVCTIFIRPEHFEIHLNDMPFASSEHLVPVGSINGIQLDGDGLVSDIRIGHPMAIQQYKQPPVTEQPSTTDGGTDVAPCIVECRMAADKRLQAAYRRDLELNEGRLNGEFSKSTFELFTPEEEDGRVKTTEKLRALPDLHRATSYQLVFGLEEDSETETAEEAKNRGALDSGKIISRPRLCKSQQNLTRIEQNSDGEDQDSKDEKQLDVNDGSSHQVDPERTRVKRFSSTLARKVHEKLEDIRSQRNEPVEKINNRPIINSRGIACFPNRSNSMSHPDSVSIVQPDLSRRQSFNRDYKLVVSRPRCPSATNLVNGSLIRDSSVKVPPRSQLAPNGSLCRQNDMFAQQTRDQSMRSNANNYRPVLRSAGQRHTINAFDCAQNGPRIRTYKSASAGNRVVQGQQLNSAVDCANPRRATIATDYHGTATVCPGVIRAPLTLLDQQWDQILPSLPTLPDSTLVGDHSSMSTDTNTNSSTSEENRPPYVHWYSQIKNKSRPASMAVCDNQTFDPLMRKIGTIDPKMQTRPTSGLPNSPGMDNIPRPGNEKATPDLPVNGITVDSLKNKEMQNTTRNNTDSVMPNLSQSGDDSDTTGKIAHTRPHNPLTSITCSEDDMNEPLLLIDCIPMDETICVIQQPLEAWPAYVKSPELPQLVRPWSNRLSLHLESHTYTRPVTDAVERPTGDFGDNTESVLSGITMRTDGSNLSSEFDVEEVEEEQANSDPLVPSVHDPRPTIAQNNDSTTSQEQAPTNTPIPERPVSFDLLSPITQPPAADNLLTEESEPHAPVCSSKTMSDEKKPVSAEMSKLPVRVPTDLRRSVLKKQLAAELSEVAAEQHPQTSHSTSIPTATPTSNSISTTPLPSSPPHTAPVVTAEKTTTVPKLFRALSGRKNLLNGIRTPKLNRKTINPQTSTNVTTQPTTTTSTAATTSTNTANGQIPPVTLDTATTQNGHTNDNGTSPNEAKLKPGQTAESIKKSVRSPKRWFSKRLTGAKM